MFEILVLGILILFWILDFGFWISSIPETAAAANLTTRLHGRLLLQVQDRGQVWYVNPADGTRYEVNADNVVAVFQRLALGITDADLEKIPTHPNGARAVDSDGDGYTDNVEAAHGYNLFGAGRAHFDQTLSNRLSGRLLLHVQNRGQVWYVNPLNNMKYEITPSNALTLFRTLALGITNTDLSRIVAATGQPDSTPIVRNTPPPSPPSATPITSPANETAAVMTAAANALRTGDANAAAYFTPTVRNAVTYTLNALDAGGLVLLGNLLSSAAPSSENATEAAYTTSVSFNGQNIAVNFMLQKQPDGAWLLANL